MEAGVDSLAATELSSSLRASTEIALSPTLLFEQPTARAIATHVVEMLADVQAPAAAVVQRVVADGESSVGLVGGAVLWPGDVHKKVTIDRLETASGDAVSNVPAKRWTLSEFVDVGALANGQLTASGFGGFIRSAERFDPRFFNMSGSEAGAMDPQQRLLLELGYVAMHRGGERRTSLLGSDVAIYVGFEQPDWKIAQTLMPFKELSAAYAGTGSNGSIAAGRISFVLGMQGACMSMDTACSSALVAADACSLALQSHHFKLVRASPAARFNQSRPTVPVPLLATRPRRARSHPPAVQAATRRSSVLALLRPLSVTARLHLACLAFSRRAGS